MENSLALKLAVTIQKAVAVGLVPTVQEMESCLARLANLAETVTEQATEMEILAPEI